MGLPLLVILLIPTGIYFTIRTKFLPIRLFPDMIRALTEKGGKKGGLSSFQTLMVSTATRVGMGNLVGVVAAISAGGAGAVFWMWITALLGSSTAFIEGTLAQLTRKRSALWRVPRWAGILYASFFARRKRWLFPDIPYWQSCLPYPVLICWCGIKPGVPNWLHQLLKMPFSYPASLYHCISRTVCTDRPPEKMPLQRFWTFWFQSWLFAISSFYTSHHLYPSRTDAVSSSEF